MQNEFVENLILTVFILGIARLEIRRSLRILVRKEVVLLTGIPLLLKLLEVFEFPDLAMKIKNNLSDQKTVKVTGILGLIFGIILTISSLVSLIKMVE